MSERTLQERLRNPPDSLTGSPCVDETTADEAADRIDALDGALKRIDTEHIIHPAYPNGHLYHIECDLCNARDIARAALNPKDQP